MNILLWLSYKGTRYAGFQVQPNGVTVCAVVLAAGLAVILYTRWIMPGL